MTIRSWLHGVMRGQVQRRPRLGRLVRSLAQHSAPGSVVVLEYSVHPRPRWPQGQPHPALHRILTEQRDVYQRRLESFLPFGDALGRIALEEATAGPTQPFWRNHWMPALDAAALYCFIAQHKPRRIIEVGSGNSTKFARRAIADHRLDTELISIDPHPRAEIDRLCDRVIREPLEDIDLALFDALDQDDILFVDSSHRALMNSDVTAAFLDVFPRLRKGVLVQVHDIALPFDYPPNWANYFFSEQYLLAAYLLGGNARFEVLLPNAFICADAELHGALAPLREQENLRDLAFHGMSFWLRTV